MSTGESRLQGAIAGRPIVFTRGAEVTPAQVAWFRQAGPEERNAFLISGPVRIRVFMTSGPGGTAPAFVPTVQNHMVGLAGHPDYFRTPEEAQAVGEQLQAEVRRGAAERGVTLPVLDLAALGILPEDTDEYSGPGSMDEFLDDVALAALDLPDGEEIRRALGRHPNRSTDA